MKPFELNKEQLYKEFRTNDAGLAITEIKNRQEQFGLNIIDQKKKKTIIKSILNSL